MSSAFVGETRLPKNFKRYARQFSLLELDCEPGSIPGKARLEACAAAAPEGFVFSLVVPSRVASLEPGPELDKALKAAEATARLLKARWWVVRTPAAVRPTRRSREGLAALVARLRETGMRVAWEPRGVWDEAAAGAVADQLGITLAQDIARERPRGGPVLYARLLAFGTGGRIGLSLADRIAERMRAYEEAFVVVEGQGAREIQQSLGLWSDEALDGAADPGARAVAGGGGEQVRGARAGAEDAEVEDEDEVEDDDDDEDEDEDEDEDGAAFDSDAETGTP